MTRKWAFGGAALAAVALTVVVVRAQEGETPPPADDAAIEEREEEAARLAEQDAREAEQRAREAVERAEAMAEKARAVAEQAAAAAEAAAEKAVGEARLLPPSEDVLIDADPFAAPVPFGAPADVLIPGHVGPKRVEVFARGQKWTRKLADPESMKMFELERKVSGQIAELVAKYKSLTDEEERRDVGEELSARIGDQFTVRQSLREKELVALEEQVERLRGLHDKRNDQKERIINDRVQQLLREAEGLGWGEGGGEGSGFGWGQFGGKFGEEGAALKFHIEGLPGVAPAPTSAPAAKPVPPVPPKK